MTDLFLFVSSVQLLNRFETLHKLGYVHCDLKPDNFLIGRGEKVNQIYMIDFGLARQYTDPINGHIEYVQHNYLRGEPYKVVDAVLMCPFVLVLAIDSHHLLHH